MVSHTAYSSDCDPLRWSFFPISLSSTYEMNSFSVETAAGCRVNLAELVRRPVESRAGRQL